ncbi:MAG: flagellar biosynthesis protein FliQ [bacterium]|nr:flagellar biosynthesis protein FliQ [bacterium]
MTEEFALYIVKEAMWTALILSAPMIIAGLIIGLIVSIFQAVTSINEMTIALVTKILAVIFVGLFTFPWMVGVMTSFTTMIFNYITQIAK